MANVSFSYRDSEWSTGTNTIVEGTLQLERQMGVWTMFPTVTNSASNTLSATGIPLTTSSWTAAMLFTPLPVELLSFSGKRINEREVQLDWSTATEHNNAGFEVWRMLEGEDDFTEVGWVDGAGDSQQRTDYGHVDANDADRTSYYKLKQVDHDGQHQWSPVVAVAAAQAGAQLVAYPNPAQDQVRLTGLPEGTSGVALHDASGRLVRSWGPTVVLDGLEGLKRGVYTLQVDAAEPPRPVRLVLQ
jgi:hypothetical protein